MNHVEREVPVQCILDNSVGTGTAAGVESITDKHDNTTFGANRRKIVKGFERACGGVEDSCFRVLGRPEFERGACVLQVFRKGRHECGGIRKTNNSDARSLAKT